MKALTIKQPWAELILKNKKRIEIRKWDTDFRGEFLIHSSKNPDREAMEFFKFKDLPCGYIIGKATLTDVKKYANEEEFLEDKDFHLADFTWGNRGFKLDNIKRIIKIFHKGKLKFWDYMGRVIESKLVGSEEDIKRVTSYLRSLNLDYPDYQKWVDRCESELRSGYKKGYYVEKDLQIAGVVIFQPHKQDESVLEIKNFNVSSKYSELGIGSLLFDSLEDYFEKVPSFRKMQVDTHEDNSKIIDFFKKRGFNIIKKEPLYEDSRIETILQKEK